MTAKAYLEQIRNIEAEIYRIEQTVRNLEADLRGARGIRHDAVRVQTSPVNVMEQMIAELEESRRDWVRKKTELTRTVTRIQTMLECLEPRYAELLYWRYVDGKPMYKIAQKMGYSYEWTRHLHNQALAAFEREFGPNYKQTQHNTPKRIK